MTAIYQPLSDRHGPLVMIRLSELKLPLDAAFDPPDASATPPLFTPALAPLIAQTLGVKLQDIAHWQVFKRSFDARKKLLVVYIVDVNLHNPQQEALLLKQHTGNPHIQATPDMQWRPPVQAPADWGQDTPRPVVVGQRCDNAPKTPGVCGASPS
jgi:hypothetical protein